MAVIRTDHAPPQNDYLSATASTAQFCSRSRRFRGHCLPTFIFMGRYRNILLKRPSSINEKSPERIWDIKFTLQGRQHRYFGRGRELISKYYKDCAGGFELSKIMKVAEMKMNRRLTAAFARKMA